MYRRTNQKAYVQQILSQFAFRMPQLVDTRPSSHSSSIPGVSTLQLSWSLTLHRHTLIYIERFIWATQNSVNVGLLPEKQTAVDEVGSYHPARLVGGRDVEGVVLDVAVEKGFAGAEGSMDVASGIERRCYVEGENCGDETYCCCEEMHHVHLLVHGSVLADVGACSGPAVG